MAMFTCIRPQCPRRGKKFKRRKDCKSWKRYYCGIPCRKADRKRLKQQRYRERQKCK